MSLLKIEKDGGLACLGDQRGQNQNESWTDLRVGGAALKLRTRNQDGQRRKEKGLGKNRQLISTHWRPPFIYFLILFRLPAAKEMLRRRRGTAGRQRQDAQTAEV